MKDDAVKDDRLQHQPEDYPMLKKNQEISTNPCGTPPMGTSIFPTNGINHAGFMCSIIKYCCWIHTLITYSVSTRWRLVPVIQRRYDNPSNTGKKAMDNRIRLIDMAGKKLIFTGWRSSASTACGKRINFTE